MRTDENRWEPMGTDKNWGFLGLLLLLDVCDLQRDTERIIQEHYPGTPEGLRAEIRERVLFGVVLCTAVHDLSPLQMLSCPFLLTVVFSAFAASP